jgi:hypothetical protein
MEVDRAEDQDAQEEDQETDDEQPGTPQPLEEEDATTTDDESSPPSVAKGKQDRVQGQVQKTSSGRPVMNNPAAPPPRREMPFARKAQGQQSNRQTRAQQAEENAEETAGETDDDEL